MTDLATPDAAADDGSKTPNPWPELRVSALYGGRLGRDIDDFAPTHIVSLIDPDLEAHRRPVLPAHAAVIQRPFWDVDSPRAEAADAATITALVAFLEDWARADAARLLVHCHMGVSRSTATAYLALAIAAGPGHEPAAFDRLLAVTTKPWPNPLVVRLADEALGRRGALVAPLDVYRARYARRLHAYRRLNARRGLY